MPFSTGIAQGNRNKASNGTNNAATDSGAAYIFIREGTGWTERAYLKTSNCAAGHRAGYSVAISKETVVVGAVSAGAAHVFTLGGTNWIQQAYLNPPNPTPNNGFGVAVAISGDTAVVAAHQEDGGSVGMNGVPSTALEKEDSGAAYVFARFGSGWAYKAYLKASNTGAGDHFGIAAGLSGDTAVLGAHSEDSNARTVNGDQGDRNYSFNAGSAYVFGGIAFGPRLVIRTVTEGYSVHLTGTPNTTYELERAETLEGPWDVIEVGEMPSSGSLEIADTNAPVSKAFYRIRHQ